MWLTRRGGGGSWKMAAVARQSGGITLMGGNSMVALRLGCLASRRLDIKDMHIKRLQGDVVP